MKTLEDEIKAMEDDLYLVIESQKLHQRTYLLEIVLRTELFPAVYDTTHYFMYLRVLCLNVKWM